jgi:hypothetical protein
MEMYHRLDADSRQRYRALQLDSESHLNLALRAVVHRCSLFRLCGEPNATLETGSYLYYLQIKD